MKIVMICSGGLDSTVLYYYEKSLGNEIIPINFSYGSKHNYIERKRLKENISNVLEINIDLSFLHSSLLLNQGEIPHGHYQEESMKSTVVPFRNGIMISYAAAIAEDNKFDYVMLGSHAGDHSIYPDCRVGFTKAISKAVKYGTYNKTKVISPFNEKNKAEIVKIGYKLKIEDIMYNTWSCYEGEEIHCGQCGACVERKEAFILAGVLDKTVYKSYRT